LTGNGFYVNKGTTAASENNYVMAVDSAGLKVKGEITATTGSIGAWSIGEIGSGWSTTSTYKNSLYSITAIDNIQYLAFLRIPASADGNVFSIR
jgi:hypothetical protein